MIFAILATGPSMSQAVADSVKGRCKVIAVSDAYRLAPWADVLVSSDTAWWKVHKPEFSGRKFSTQGNEGTEKLPGVAPNSNSGVLAIKVAKHLGATRIILLGFDGHGTHFFGAHKPPLRNTLDVRRKVHLEQHRVESRFSPGVEILNCTPGSRYDCYPMATLEDVLC